MSAPTFIAIDGKRYEYNKGYPYPFLFNNMSFIPLAEEGSRFDVMLADGTVLAPLPVFRDRSSPLDRMKKTHWRLRAWSDYAI